MHSGGMALDGNCREVGTFAFSAIRLNLAFSEISSCTFNEFHSIPLTDLLQKETVPVHSIDTKL